MCTFHRTHQLLRNLRDSQWNPRTIGKRKEDSQQVCITVAFAGTILIMKVHRRLGLDNILKGTSGGPSLTFFSFLSPQA